MSSFEQNKTHYVLDGFTKVAIFGNLSQVRLGSFDFCCPNETAHWNDICARGCNDSMFGFLDHGLNSSLIRRKSNSYARLKTSIMVFILTSIIRGKKCRTRDRTPMGQSKGRKGDTETHLCATQP